MNDLEEEKQKKLEKGKQVLFQDYLELTDIVYSYYEDEIHFEFNDDDGQVRVGLVAELDKQILKTEDEWYETLLNLSEEYYFPSAIDALRLQQMVEELKAENQELKAQLAS